MLNITVVRPMPSVSAGVATIVRPGRGISVRERSGATAAGRRSRGMACYGKAQPTTYVTAGPLRRTGARRIERPSLLTQKRLLGRQPGADSRAEPPEAAAIVWLPGSVA